MKESTLIGWLLLICFIYTLSVSHLLKRKVVEMDKNINLLKIEVNVLTKRSDLNSSDIVSMDKKLKDLGK